MHSFGRVSPWEPRLLAFLISSQHVHGGGAQPFALSADHPAAPGLHQPAQQPQGAGSVRCGAHCVCETEPRIQDLIREKSLKHLSAFYIDYMLRW